MYTSVDQDGTAGGGSALAIRLPLFQDRHHHSGPGAISDPAAGPVR
jgi:hypothetical protein